MNPRTPVLAAAATVTSRADPPDGLEAIELAHEVVRRLGHPDLLRKVGLILVPNGTWRYEDPGRAIAARVGADARSVVAEVGVLQQTILSRACDTVAAGDADAVLVVGFEAKRRDLLAAKAGIPLDVTDAPGPPDDLLLPEGDILTRAEIERDLAVPAHQYAIIENALFYGDPTYEERLGRLGRLWSRFAAVAGKNREAVDRSAPGAAEITTPTAENRMIASPYTKRLCSQWNVDQAVALLFTSTHVAEAHGVSRDDWTFPVVAAESNHMTTMPERGLIAGSPATRLLGEALTDHVGLEPNQVDHLDIYSCFPAAVQVQAHELGIPLDRTLTVTGGMTFAGGPLNSYALHATAAMARVLHEDGGGTGLVTSVSGMLTKTGLGLWSSDPPARPWRSVDVSAAAARATMVRNFQPEGTGRGPIIGSTVVHDRGIPSRVVAVVQLGGSHTVAVESNATVARDLVHIDLCGRLVTVVRPGVMTID